MTNYAKIKLRIDVTSAKQMEVASNFLRELSKIAEQEANGDSTLNLVTETVVGKTKIATKEKAQSTPDTVKTEPAAPLAASDIPSVDTAPVDTAPVDTAPESKFKIEDVRAAVATKVKEHKDAIKAKLSSFGAPNVGLLDASHYEEFVNFINAL